MGGRARRQSSSGETTTSSSASSGPARLDLHARGDERLAAVREHDDVTGLDVRAGCSTSQERRSSLLVCRPG